MADTSVSASSASSAEFFRGPTKKKQEIRGTGIGGVQDGCLSGKKLSGQEATFLRLLSFLSNGFQGKVAFGSHARTLTMQFVRDGICEGVKGITVNGR